MTRFQTQITRRAALSVLASFVGAGMSAPSWASESDYPSRPVKILVPFQPAGPNDIITRLIAPKLSENLGKTFYVENQGGAGGNIGMGAVARAAPDGLTLISVSSTFVINPSLYKSCPYDPAKHFAPITVVAESPHVYFVHPSVPANSMTELLDLIKNNPGKYSYASPGAGTPAHLATEQLKLTFGLDFTHVPFRGAGPAVQSVLGGHTPVGCATIPPAFALIKAGQLRPLVVTSLKRFSTIAEVPTISEAGIKDQEGTTFMAFLAPAGTPSAIVDFLYREIAKITNEPAMKDRMTELGFKAVTNTPADFAKQIEFEVAKWAKVIREAKIEPL